MEERLEQAQRIGTVVSLPDVALAELTASFVDFVWIDLEHGALSVRDVQPLAIAARSGGAESFVRLASSRDPRVSAVIDAGVDGVVVPRVEDPSEAEAVVNQLRYPPDGCRGLAARRASRHGVDRPCCVVQIESRAGAEAADRIAAVGGVGALVVGCADLVLETGESLDGQSPLARDAIARVRGACENAGLAFGMAGPGDPRVMVELAGAVPSIAVLAADVRIYAGALTGLREAHVCS